ncbi:hypothetical protein LCGC14_1221770 [marine sediment metagenome]|uniref:B box-type domain-containing protein n=1 Tax=marine sediment metagenome TaxID=412755 RepID=A0A0F9LF19_9ZZZZ
MEKKEKRGRQRRCWSCRRKKVNIEDKCHGCGHWVCVHCVGRHGHYFDQLHGRGRSV